MVESNLTESGYLLLFYFKKKSKLNSIKKVTVTNGCK
jgi:hypothetical protein